MKKIAFLIAGCLSLILSDNLRAQTKIERAGVILTQEDASAGYYLENVTNDSIMVIVVNHQEKFEELGDNIIAVSSGKHMKVVFTIPPKTKMSLSYIICIHSIGLLVGDSMLEYKFYATK